MHRRRLETEFYICCVMKEMTPGKKRLIPLLMGVSLLMLTLILVQWLSWQYRKEYARLGADIKDVIVEAHDDLTDSLLMRYLIKPVLNDSIHRGNVSVSGDLTISASGKNRDSGRKLLLEGDTLLLKDQPYTIREGDSGEIERPARASGVFLVDSGPSASVYVNDESLLRSVKLIMTFRSDSADAGAQMHHFLHRGDSSLFRNIFFQRLETENVVEGYKVEWIAEEGAKPQKSKQRFVIPMEEMAESYGIEVSGFRWHLIKELAPQFLFAFLLLGITAMAFLMTWRSLRRQMEVNLLRNEFVGNISHELKTPVATVKLALEALQKYDLKSNPQTSAEYLQMAHAETRRLEQLVQKVLDHSLLDNGNGLLHKTENDLLALAREAVESLRLRVQETGATLSVEAGEGPFLCVADPVYVRAVILNLLDNSLKYAGEKPSVQVSLKSSPKEIQLSVADDGPGIPAAYRQKVFERFFRVPSDNIHEVKGHGLGLSFARLVMRQHDGRIEYKDHKEKGCIFTIVFPLEA